MVQSKEGVLLLAKLNKIMWNKVLFIRGLVLAEVNSENSLATLYYL